MSYVLTTWHIGQSPEIVIDERRYAQLRDAVGTEGAALQIEEKFDLLLSNYEEFEREILKMALRYMIKPTQTPSTQSAEWLDLDRRLANLLTTCKLYVDQVRHDLVEPPLNLNSDEAAKPFRAEYDRNLGYRVMEALRNHFQHRSLSARGSYHAHSQAIETTEVWAFNITVTPDLDHLRADENFKSSVLRELEAQPEAARDIVLFVRQYVEGLARVHAHVRTLTDNAVKNADAAVSAAVEEWRAAGRDPRLLSAAQILADRTRSGVFFISMSAQERRGELARLNSVLAGLSRRYVTSIRSREAYLASTQASAT